MAKFELYKDAGGEQPIRGRSSAAEQRHREVG